MERIPAVSIYLLCVVIYSPAFAHHSRANFDDSREVELTGTVKQFSWRNPHVYLEIDVPDEAGTVETWLIETHSVTSMQRFGWNRDSLQPGDPITIKVQPDRNSGNRFALLQYMLTPDGTRMYAFRDNRNTPGPEVEPSMDFSGTWYAVRTELDIRLAGGGPPQDWPYTGLGRQNLHNYDEHESPQYDCLPVGVPKMTFYSYAINLKRDGDGLYIDKEHLNERRTVHFNRTRPELADQLPSVVGTSVGRFESERHLIIETDNFLPTKWGLANGINSSEQKVMTENYRLADDGMFIDISYTLTDPAYLTEPVTVTGQYRKAESREFMPVACDPATAKRHLVSD
ncbi:MAG: DUF6152 family protein [Proteobacteria bacterium]|nr:DUF6152 family protein [Pseudomonadota bacterium]MDA0994243.1 DUF6152 family protein [Pseudomonadota bacterium]